jgi:5-hydroxyisourate hydrolase-like protein (transthyretin family)
MDTTANNIDKGTLRIHLVNESTGIPIEGAKIDVSYTGNPSQILEEVNTDDSGNTETLTLDAPPLEYSMEPGEQQPYSEYTIHVQAPGYRDITISAIDILPGEEATQEVMLETEDGPGNRIDTIVIPAHTLYGDYPAKIPEDEIKPINETGEIVLSRVVVPEYVVVHDGSPSDSTAANYYVRYRDYIKNVASSEIYATWPDATIRANVLAIMSFTLNRVYTEW